MKKFHFTTLFFLLLSLITGGHLHAATETIDRPTLEKFYQSEAARLAALMQRVMVQANDLHPRYEKLAQFIAKRQEQLKAKSGLIDFPWAAPKKIENLKSTATVVVFGDEKKRFEELLKSKENQAPSLQKALKDLIHFMDQLISEEKSR